MFEEVLGHSFHYVLNESAETVIQLGNSRGAVRVPDCFFEFASSAWLGKNSTPRYEGRDLCVKLIGQNLRQVPVFSNVITSEAQLEVDALEVRIPIDIFGVLFVLISRYGECIADSHDSHGRIRAEDCLLGKHGFQDRAIGNEYIEVLWAAMKHIWPGLKRKDRSFRILPSHDIDWPTMFGTHSLLRCGKLLMRDSIKRKTAGSVTNLFVKPLQFLIGDYDRDPYNQIGWIMDQSEKQGLKSAFYYIPEKTHNLDPGMPIDHPAVERQWKQISSRGHEIGIHPGYETWVSAERIKSGVARFRQQFDKLGIQQLMLGGRQHFLRWKTSNTGRHLNDAGLDYDSTLGFAEHPGFRCGVCYEFPMYDVVERKALRIRQRPLIAMDCSVTDQRYMGLGLTPKAFSVFQHFKSECEKYKGDFTLLWHNTSLITPAEREFYASVIGC